MGQHHQIYLIYRDFSALDRKDANPTPPVSIIGLWHTWLPSGVRAVQQAKRLLTLVQKKGEQYVKYDSSNPFYEPDMAFKSLQMLYSMIPEDGYWDFRRDDMRIDDCSDPASNQNCDGISIFDITDFDKPKYCFMAVDGLECCYSLRNKVKNFVPFSASQYLDYYFPASPTSDWQKWYRNGREYPPKVNKLSKADMAKTNELIKLKLELVAEHKKAMAGFEVLSLKRVQEMFPVMFGIESKMEISAT